MAIALLVWFRTLSTILIENLGGGSCCYYYVKVKSTPSLDLGKKFICFSRQWAIVSCTTRLIKHGILAKLRRTHPSPKLPWKIQTKLSNSLKVLEELKGRVGLKPFLTGCFGCSSNFQRIRFSGPLPQRKLDSNLSRESNVSYFVGQIFSKTGAANKVTSLPYLEITIKFHKQFQWIHAYTWYLLGKVSELKKVFWRSKSKICWCSFSWLIFSKTAFIPIIAD